MLLSLLLLLHLSATATQTTTRQSGRPPGWRTDQPNEEGGTIVERMLRKLGSKAAPGRFFSEYQKAFTAMHTANERHLRPATLLPEGMSTDIDDEMQSSLKAVEDAFKWQSAQVDILETFEKTLQQSKTAGAKADDVQTWPLELVSKFLLVGGVVAEAELAMLSSQKRVSVARDLAKVHNVFRWTFANMPDEEEAQAITRKINAEQGLPPPSQPPPPPPGAPPRHHVASGESSAGAGAPGARKRRARRKRKKDEL